MKRSLKRLGLVGLVSATVFATGMSVALADRGGVPHDGSCGVGREAAHEAIEDSTMPGASEAAHNHGDDCGPYSPLFGS